MSESSVKEELEAVDILLGEDLIEAVLYEERMSRIKPNVTLSFEETRYGWILRGHTGKPTNQYTNCVYVEPKEDNGDFSPDYLPKLFGIYHVYGPVFNTPPLANRSAAQSNEPAHCVGLCTALKQVLQDPLSDDSSGNDRMGGEW